MPYNERVRNAFNQYFEDFVFLKAFLLTRISFQIWRIVILRCHPVRYLTSLSIKKKEIEMKKNIFFMMYQSLHFPTFIFEYWNIFSCEIYNRYIKKTLATLIYTLVIDLDYFLLSFFICFDVSRHFRLVQSIFSSIIFK